MAEIQVERTKKSSATGWTIIVLVLVALLGAGWYFAMGPGAALVPDLPGSPSDQAPAQPTGGAEGAVTPPVAPR
jgi:hypothetical protein